MSSTKATGLVKPPVRVFGVAGRYAEALYSAASKNNALEAVEKDLAQVRNLANADAAFNEFLNTPLLKRSDKKKLAIDITKKIKLNALSQNLLGALAENNRLDYTLQVADAYDTIMRAQRGIVSCNVASANPLDQSFQNQLQQALKGFVKPNEKITFNFRVEPTIIGGLVIELGDKYIDMSVLSRIQKLSQTLREAL
ncbi:H+ transporting ATP synthase O subunit isoform 2 [Capsaspora owczarzaki ATCC 30864]|uniref:H+ transporting ATP synthase O subunit isoform 2 n=1 Tax=Capsaspora owczarzaki (strain ATCC 30864) TaxID=595528 RepID=A0A0D2WYF7_CAPO3|nr:H+ transporting ATP synthase O subunit isoform 2 [Capsaspora owczarzaki ATCC 30864]KJE97958.1 H+ transporting ATP synthase O subunit isoform 2 [Capsaspora owczarzaki ATCC 30864]|eukprot:XP_004342624.1 H+ transporting ATP synthase O subunit isoform 2 [Capsaspora owczarzaki ATCC 30864]